MEKSEQVESNHRTWYRKPLLYPLSYILLLALCCRSKRVPLVVKRRFSVRTPDSRISNNLFVHEKKRAAGFMPLATFLSYNEITEKSEKTSCDFHFL